jgi:hypothetical protein
LITFEDPIEALLIKADDETTGKIEGGSVIVLPSHKYDIDYTPREKGRDAACLEDALKDALRQTPAIFYVGETRDEGDWERLIKFAGTGHLVVTTSHAGSLIEAMQAIFQATKAKTPAQRSNIASKILAIVHLKADEVERPSAPVPFQLAVPALWRRTGPGLNALIADGLASLLPCPATFKDYELEKASYLGRAWFANKLIDYATQEANNLSDTGIVNDIKAVSGEICKRAKKWDFKGE